MWLEILKVVGAIIGAAIAAFGGGFLTYKKFIIERQDAKDKALLQKQIDDSIDKAMGRFIAECGEIGDHQIAKAKNEVRKEFEEGLKLRRDESTERYLKHSEEIEANTEMIKEILKIQKDQAKKFDMLAESMTSLNKVVMASAESQRNSNYDRLLFVANKVLKSGKMTISEKTNIKQLYNSWKDLSGVDPKIDTLYEECMKLTPIPDESV